MEAEHKMGDEQHSRARHCTRVLLLGDGDFSFSLAFAQALAAFPHSDACCICGHVQLLATSFDSFEVLCEKYVDVQRILPVLTSKPKLSGKQPGRCRTTVSVAVQHGVDATNVYHTLQGPDEHKRFDLVIFNFPHLSTEDAQLHSQMLAHIMYSCSDRRILLSGGALYITLADSQPKNWKIAAMVRRTSMQIDSRIKFLSGAFAGYTSQRHNGRTFRHRVEEACTFILHRQGEVISVPRVMESILHEYETALPCAVAIEKMAAAEISSGVSGQALNAAVETVPTVRINENTGSDGLRMEPKQNKKRKHHSYNLMTNIERTQDDKYLCILCDKPFGTMQGAKTHIHMVHTLRVKTADSEDNREGSISGEYCCEHCGKVCADADGLHQHTVAKHTGMHTNWRKQSPGRPAVMDTDGLKQQHECEICGAIFATAADLHHHGSSGFVPLEHETVECTKCGKQVSDRRALFQHENFCSKSDARDV